MAVDFGKPVNTDLYQGVLAQLNENTAAAMKQNPGDDALNIPEGAIRFSDGNSRWEKRVSGAWAALRTLAQVFNIKVKDSELLNGENAAWWRNADNINTGTLHLNRVPNLPADQVTSGEFDEARVPELDAGKIATGALPADRVGELPAGKVTSDKFDPARIPNLDAAVISTGNLARPWKPANSHTLARITLSASAPSGTSSGTLWMQY